MASFGYPVPGADGVRRLTDAAGPFRDALMDTAVWHMTAGMEKHVLFPEEECAFLLVEGEVSFTWTEAGDPEVSAEEAAPADHASSAESAKHTAPAENAAQGNDFAEGQAERAFHREERAARKTCFDDGAEVAALHVPRNTPVTVRAYGDAEIFLAHTENQRGFPARFYRAAEIRNVTSCAGILGGVCERKVTTVFDDVTAPYSQLVLGETYPLPGKWCGYPPHSHPQPEVYYYRVDRPEGFGFCCVGDEVYKIRDHSFSLLAHGAMHPQAAAPGYHLYIIWVIRHLPGNPWHRGPNLPEYQWLEKEP